MTSLPRKVLIVAEFGILNGGERSLLAVLPGLMASSIWQPVALTPANTELERALNQLGVDTFPFSKQNPQGQRFTQQELRQRLEEQIRSIKPDLIHCNSLWTSRLCGPVARRLQIPAIGYVRDILKLTRQAMADLNQLDRIVTVSNATREYHVAQGMDAQRAVVIYNGVDLNQFSPDRNPATPDIRSQLGIPSDAPLLLYVGQLSMRKGIDLLLESFIQLARRNPDCCLLIVGERNSINPEAILFENQTREMSKPPKCPDTIADRIHWLGRRDDVAGLMREATLLIHPARQEPLGRVLLEAAASGLPLVTTSVGGTPEILQGLQMHRLQQPLEASAIAKRCEELLADAAAHRCVSVSLRSMAETRFTESRSANLLAALYQRTHPSR